MTHTQATINRTLILALGESPMGIIEAFHARLNERRSGLLPDHEDLPIASVALTVGPCDSETAPNSYWAALDDHVDEITAGITTALAGISHIPRTIGSGDRLRSAQVDVYLVAALEDPMAGILVDIVYLVRHLISRRLNTRARIGGLLLLPDTLTLDDPEPALARTYAALKTIDVYMGAHDGYRRPYANGTVIEGWGPMFDGECFLIGALTRDGLRLAQPEARKHLVAEALIQIVASPIGRAALTAEPALQQLGSRPSYASLGIASLVYPAHAVHECLARRLARQVLEGWSSDLPNQPEATQAVAFLSENGFDPESIRERVLPRGLLAEAGVGYPVTVDRPWGQLDTLRDAIDDTVARRLEALNAHRSDLEGMADALANDLSRLLRNDLAKRIDPPQPAGLQHALALAQVLKDQLLALERSETENADERWKTFQALGDEIEGVGQRLAEVGARLAAYRPTTLRNAVSLMLKPHRWLEIWRTWHTVQQTKMTYIAHLERQIELTVVILESDLIAHYLREAAAHVERLERKLTDLLDTIEAAVREPGSGGAEEPRSWGAEELGSGEPGGNSPLHLCASAPLHNLEWSALTPGQVEELYRETVDDLAAELSAFGEMQGPLSVWIEQTPDASEVSAAALVFSRHRLQPVMDVTVGQLLAARYPDADQREAVIESLLGAAVPFLAWDETVLQAGDGEVVRQTAVLGIPAADFELVETSIESLRRSASFVPTLDPYRLVALTVVQGIPLAAIPIVCEAGACYARAPEPAMLHGDPTDVDLPDLLVKRKT